MAADARWLLLASLVTVGLFSFLLALAGLRGRRQESRLQELIRPEPGPQPPKSAVAPAARQTMLQGLALSTLPRLGAPLLPSEDEGRTQLETQLRRAGYYQPQAPVVYLGAKVALLLLTLVLAVTLERAHVLRPTHAAILGGSFSGLAVMLPGVWLDYRTRQRQQLFRRSLPDALDVMVICLEAGLSLSDAIRRVSAELRTAHPLLAVEMGIIQREILLGLSAGEAVRRSAQRCDLEEVRSLAAVISQSERFGASMTKALRVQADQLRIRRHQRAEERAQRAAVFILLPTLLCIFPAVFLVILGPAVLRIMEMFQRMGG